MQYFQTLLAISASDTHDFDTCSFLQKVLREEEAGMAMYIT